MCSKIAKWRIILAILLELYNLARHERLKPILVVSQKMGLLVPTCGLSFVHSRTHSLMFQPKPIFTKMGRLVPIVGLLRITSSVLTLLLCGHTLGNTGYALMGGTGPGRTNYHLPQRHST
jgi:hypothetical protein